MVDQGLWFGTVAPAKGGLSCAAMFEANRNNAQGKEARDNIHLYQQYSQNLE
jgi:hypothetical protein